MKGQNAPFTTDKHKCELTRWYDILYIHTCMLPMFVNKIKQVFFSESNGCKNNICIHLSTSKHKNSLKVQQKVSDTVIFFLFFFLGNSQLNANENKILLAKKNANSSKP